MCPRIKVTLQVIAEFFVRPFNFKDEEKSVIIKEMRRLVHLGILKQTCLHILHPNAHC